MPLNHSDCIVEKLNGNKTVIIAFSGLDHYRAENGKYDFYSLMKRDDVDVVLVRDLANSWFFRMEPGNDTPDAHTELVEYLTGIAQSHEHVVCTGHSMGGFGAVYFGHLIAATMILAFAPQFDLTTSFLHSIGYMRHAEAVASVNALPWSAEVFDMKKMLRPEGRPVYAIFGRGDQIDMKLSEAVKDNPSIRVIKLDHVTHGLIHPLSKSGALVKMLEQAMADGTVYDAAPDLQAFRSRVAYDFYLEMPISYNNATKQLSARVNITFADPDAWIKNGDPHVFVNLHNDTKKKGVGASRLVPVPVGGIVNGRCSVPVELDLSKAVNGFHSCEFCPAWARMKLLEAGHESLYFQFTLNNGDVNPVSVIRTGKGSGRMYKTQNFYLG